MSQQITVNDAIRSFAKDGFTCVESLLCANEIAEAGRAVEYALGQSFNESKWIRPRTYQWFREYPIYVALMEHPFVIDFARAWLGEDFHLIAAQCSRNTRDDYYAPGANRWHQDAVFFPMPGSESPGVPLDRYSFSAMWYVQDTPLKMGPTELAKASYSFAGEGEPERGEVFSQVMPAGSLLIFNHRTWHRGTPNNTEKPRDLITNAYARREIDKVQLTSVREDGSIGYVPCQDLLKEASPVIRQLLHCSD